MLTSGSTIVEEAERAPWTGAGLAHSGELGLESVGRSRPVDSEGMCAPAKGPWGL